MIFIIDNLKFDTDKMELISSLCRVSCSNSFGLSIKLLCKLYRSRKGNWIAVYGSGREAAIRLSEKEATSLLLQYDVPVYEKIVGELEEG